MNRNAEEGDNDRNAENGDADDDGDSAESDEYDDDDSDTNNGIGCELKSASEALHSTKLAVGPSSIVKINEKCIRRTRKKCLQMDSTCKSMILVNLGSTAAATYPLLRQSI